MEPQHKTDAQEIQDEMKDWPCLSPRVMHGLFLFLFTVQIIAAMVVVFSSKHRLGYYFGWMTAVCALVQIWLLIKKHVFDQGKIQTRL